MNAITLPLWAALTVALLLILGGLLALVGSIGLLRMKSFYARMHPPTLGTTLGAGCVLVASMIVSSTLLHRPVIHELLITVFLTLAAPVSAMTLMRAAVQRTPLRGHEPTE